MNDNINQNTLAGATRSKYAKFVSESDELEMKIKNLAPIFGHGLLRYSRI